MHPSVIGDPDAPSVYHRACLSSVIVHNVWGTAMSSKPPPQSPGKISAFLKDYKRETYVGIVSAVPSVVVLLSIGNIWLALVIAGLCLGVMPKIVTKVEKHIPATGSRSFKRLRWGVSILLFLVGAAGAATGWVQTHVMQPHKKQVIRAATGLMCPGGNRFCVVVVSIKGAANDDPIASDIRDNLNIKLDGHGGAVRYAPNPVVDYPTAVKTAMRAKADEVIVTRYDQAGDENAGLVYIYPLRHIAGAMPGLNTLYTQSLTPSSTEPPSFFVRRDKASSAAAYISLIAVGFWRDALGQHADAARIFGYATQEHLPDTLDDVHNRTLAYYYQSRASYAAADDSGALSSIRTAIKMSGNAVPAVFYVGLALSEIATHAYTEAIAVVTPLVPSTTMIIDCRSLRRGFTSNGAYFALGEAYNGNGNFPLAVNAFTNALCIDGNDEQAHRDRGDALERTASEIAKASHGLTNISLLYAAREDFASAIHLDASDPVAYVRDGEVSESLNNARCAVADYHVAATLFNRFRDMHRMNELERNISKIVAHSHVPRPTAIERLPLGTADVAIATIDRTAACR